MRRVLAATASLIAPLWLFSHYMSRLSLDAFATIGLIGILTIYLPQGLAWVSIWAVYAAVFYTMFKAFYLGSITDLMSLAAGYLLSLPLVFVLAYLKGTKPSSMFGNYVAAYIFSLFNLDVVARSDGSPPGMLYEAVWRLFDVLRGSPSAFDAVGTGSLFPAIAALSAIGFVYFVVFTTVHGSLRPSERVLSRVLLTSLAFVAGVVAYSLFYADSQVLILLTSSALLVALTTYTRWST